MPDDPAPGAFDPMAAVNAAIAASKPAPQIDPMAAVNAAISAMPAPRVAVPGTVGAALARAADPTWVQPQPVHITGIWIVGALLDTLLAVLKWPIGVLALVLLPGSARALWDVLREVIAHPGPVWYFLGGVVGYVALDQLVLARITRFGNYLATFEHELTHAIVAVLTVHKVVDFKVTRREGGHIMTIGGNWVMALAPYFLPTLSILLMIAIHFLPVAYLRWADLALGATVAYHFLSTLKETHPGQLDFRIAGIPQSFLFIPTANLIMYGIVLSFAYRGSASVGDHLQAVIKYTRHMIGK